MNKVSFVLVAVSLAALGFAPVATSAPSAECMDRYWEADVGPVTVVSRDSCSYEVYFNDGAFTTTSAAAAPCVDATPPGASDFGSKFCVNAKGPCYVTEERTTIYGSETYCRVGRGPSAASSERPFECYQVYNEWTVGPVSVVSPDSCTYNVYVNGQPVEGYLTGSKAASAGPCMYRYAEYNVGDVKVVSRSTCEYQVYYQGKPVLA